jgi:hypothetical protein
MLTNSAPTSSFSARRPSLREGQPVAVQREADTHAIARLRLASACQFMSNVWQKRRVDSFAMSLTAKTASSFARQVI